MQTCKIHSKMIKNHKNTNKVSNCLLNKYLSNKNIKFKMETILTIQTIKHFSIFT